MFLLLLLVLLGMLQSSTKQQPGPTQSMGACSCPRQQHTLAAAGQQHVLFAYALLERRPHKHVLQQQQHRPLAGRALPALQHQQLCQLMPLALGAVSLSISSTQELLIPMGLFQLVLCMRRVLLLLLILQTTPTHHCLLQPRLLQRQHLRKQPQQPQQQQSLLWKLRQQTQRKFLPTSPSLRSMYNNSNSSNKLPSASLQMQLLSAGLCSSSAQRWQL